ncbi:MAG: YlmH/Sll1252 family protein [Anaerostipes sp.]|nr:YlmH/Sll1252 family protein [Anaerostipes sp.]
MDDVILLKKRLQELAMRAYQQNVYTYTFFLTESEQDIFAQMSQEFSFVDWKVIGGHDYFTRGLVLFGSKEMFGYEGEMPMTTVRISPIFEKFAGKLTHRDYLGALMNLGIERKNLGDILIVEKDAYVFCMKPMVSFLVENLTKIAHTQVEATEVSFDDMNYKQQFEVKEGFVTSTRIDAVISFVYGLSRNASLALFQNQKVFLRGRMETRNAYQLQLEDVVSVRGYGKFLFSNMGSKSKKGRQFITISIFK